MFKCKVSQKKIKSFMSFGSMPLANGFLKKSQFKKNSFIKWKLVSTKIFLFFQLAEQPEARLMFNKDYPFFTSSSNFMINHFRLFSKWLKKK